jgi:alkylated DNA repair dioxygenase AlkB
MSSDQLPMDFVAPQEEDDHTHREDNGPLWLGLSLDHRALFEALQDDWIRPTEGAPGRVLGVRAFANEGVQSANGHRILVRIKFDLERLPRMPVYRRRAGEWVICAITCHEVDDPAVFWPGPLPTFAISELLVASDEESSRLAGLARQVSNVPLPVAPRVLRSGEDDASIPQSAAPSETLAGIGLPPEMDAVRGAMAMAMWAVPRVDPWLDLLCKSLGTDPSEKLGTLAENLRSPWLVSPPWIRTSRPQSNASPQERLWLSATSAFHGAHTGSQVMAVDLVHQIAADVSRDLTDVDKSQFREWNEETIKILRGDTKLDLSDWKASPVGKAIQLVLVRPDPSVFKKWKDDLPSLPPAVWWSAAALCGVLHGYRRLPTSFRGEPEQQRLFAIHALRALGAAPSAENWAALVQGSPEWRRQSGDIIFSWSGTPFARKPENARGRWFNANLDDVAARKAAEEISRANRWACIRTKVTVLAGDIPFSGGSLEVVPAPEQHLTLKGPTEFTLPFSAAFEPTLDTEEFRRCLVTEGASIPPPERQQRIAPPKSEEIPGLIYVPNFLTEAQETELVAVIDKGDWSSVLKRRVQHFGWRYDYKSREIDVSMRLGSLPQWAMALAKRLKAEGLLPHLPDQVIVNEYINNQGIGKHIDCVPCFDDGVAMVSLLESWEMIFREEGKGGRARVPKLLERRSVAIMTGDVRYRWSHEIPARFTEPSGLRRQRRVSVTFRKVNDAGVVREPRRSRKRQSV